MIKSSINLAIRARNNQKEFGIARVIYEDWPSEYTSGLPVEGWIGSAFKSVAVLD